jgi:hypothetical protein
MFLTCTHCQQDSIGIKRKCNYIPNMYNLDVSSISITKCKKKKKKLKCRDLKLSKFVPRLLADPVIKTGLMAHISDFLAA